MLYNSKIIFSELNLYNFNKLFYLNVFLLLYKHKSIVLTKVNHNFNTRYKSEVNVIYNSNTVFGSQCTTIIG